MYSSRTPEQRARHDIARACSTRILTAAHTDFARFCALSDRGDGDPLTGWERRELSTKCAALADSLARAAAEWDGPSPALAAAYQRLARGYRDAQALHEALAVIAPAVPGHDPLAR